MALINCPECNREISDRGTACVHCGCPLAAQEPLNEHGEVVPAAGGTKKRALIVVAACLVAVAVFFAVYYTTTVAPKNKYESAIALLELGKYSEGAELLSSMAGYKDAAEILEQVKYESMAYSCINQIKTFLKNPDSYTPYSIDFYQMDEGEDDDAMPVCVMHYAAQNGFGGNTTGYAVFTYSKEKDSYSLLGHTNTLDIDELREKDDDYLVKAFTIAIIETYRETGTAVGDIDLARIKTVLKNDAYTAIKIIE